MAQKTQGTMLYVIDPVGDEVLEVGCITNISGLDSTLEQIETTCLSADARTYVAGLATPGTATFTINADSEDESHVRLHQLKKTGENLLWAIGWSDGTVPPTVDVGPPVGFTLPATRSWITFEGFMNAFSFDFSQNAVVTSSIGIQISGDPDWIQKSA
mgnify:FL=1